MSIKEIQERDESLRMEAYYYGFDRTGILPIDKILSSVACAGKGFHHTSEWCTEYEWLNDGKSYVDLIQESADGASKTILELLGVLKRANDMINDSYQCECGNPKTPCPCLEGFLDNIQAILAGV